jgi:alpha-glucosidase
MARSSFLKAASVLSSFLALTNGQSTANSADGLGGSAIATPTASVFTTEIGGTPTTFRSIFTIPAAADNGAPLLPNVKDPAAVNAQNVCPGYKASDLKESDGLLEAVLTLAGAPCNVYGNDVEVLNLKVEYQAKSRLAINISPAYVVGY